MGRYAMSAQVGTSAVDPMLGYFGDGVVDPEVTHIVIGFSSTPSDLQYLFGLYEVTDAGTGGTSVVPKKIGHASASAVTGKKGTFTGNPTKTGVAMEPFPIYRRSRAIVQKALGDGFRTESVAANRGLCIWNDVDGGSANGEFKMEWYE